MIPLGNIYCRLLKKNPSFDFERCNGGFSLCHYSCNLIISDTCNLIVRVHSHKHASKSLHISVYCEVRNFILTLWCGFEINFHRENSAFDKEILPTHWGYSGPVREHMLKEDTIKWLINLQVEFRFEDFLWKWSNGNILECLSCLLFCA